MGLIKGSVWVMGIGGVRISVLTMGLGMFWVRARIIVSVTPFIQSYSRVQVRIGVGIII